ncbi:hypothetical protein KHS38_20620 [Mucilaginibacter sp. Bleaf8]|uniref:hypothetical protein n=1 Tax=Mucilaginibacter sp. Bleaf8 TaxID=2834430 RepID=UPI001BCFF7D0|nr:hypothetical protein [Mucilaginibacter sp. Bleaf8]MBS7566822.1 hypothetical protein [Mucilaginibacter sp. Bleaf8]
MKLLLVRPLGGIANRMRVLESAYNFAAAASSKLVVFWERNGNLNARFSECFEPVANMQVIEMDMHGSGFTDKINRRLLDMAARTFSGFLADKAITDSTIEEKLLEYNFQLPAMRNYFNALGLQNRGIRIDTCLEFYPNQKNFQLEILRPIQFKSMSILKNSGPVIGVHVRRTDNYHAIEKSPLDAFIEEIKWTISVSPQTKFYLSTDSQEVSESLKGLFPDHIIVGVSTRNRDSKEGITDALTDLCCLSMCNEIWGSQDSSFSDRAAKIKNIPLKIILQHAG